MAILYKLIIDNPKREIVNTTTPNSNIGNWQKDFEYNDSLTNFRSGIIKSVEHVVDGDVVRTIYTKIFNDRAEFDIWAETNRLTDPVIKSAVAEWDSAYNITRTEIVYEMDEVSRSAILS